MTGETSAAAAAQASQIPLIQSNTREGSRLARRFFALVAFAATSWHVPLEAQTLLVFDDKSAFLAASGAASATGPLPDIGVVADSGNPGGTAHVGSLTFSLAPGGNNLSIGAAGTGAAPDWYPETPGNDIATQCSTPARISAPSPTMTTPSSGAVRA